MSTAVSAPVNAEHDRKRPSIFGPSALATPANAITLARLLAAPVLVVMVALTGPGWATFAVAFAVAGTDGVDGWIARRQGTTRSGAFLDPLADKAVVLGALAALAARGEIAWGPVAVIAAREIGMQAYRTLAGRRGLSIPARSSAKVKTLAQDAALGLCLLPLMAHHSTALNAVLWVVAAVTVVTGLQYLLDARRAASVAAILRTDAHAHVSSREPRNEPSVLRAVDDDIREAAR
jgi:CDP-diacylglycerol--glycerol-3-phosphate 3-phosphatidyltransferase